MKDLFGMELIKQTQKKFTNQILKDLIAHSAKIIVYGVLEFILLKMLLTLHKVMPFLMINNKKFCFVV